jgi:hypothetical protein
MQEYLIILKSWETSPAPPTKQPLTGKLSQRKQAEQEFELIKGLATSIAERQNKQHETADTHDESMSSLICDRIIGRTWAKNDKFGQTPYKQCIVPSTNGNTIIPRGKQHRIFISSWSTTQLVFTQSTNDEFPLLPKGAAEFPKYI